MTQLQGSRRPPVIHRLKSLAMRVIHPALAKAGAFRIPVFGLVWGAVSKPSRPSCSFQHFACLDTPLAGHALAT